MEKWFHVSFYKENLRRLRGVGMIVLVIMLLQAILVPLGTFIIDGPGRNYTYDADRTYSFRAIAALMHALPFVAYGFMRNLLKDLNTRNGSDFYQALPVSRRAMLLTGIAAVMSWVGIVTFIPAAVEILLYVLMGYFVNIYSVFGMFLYVAIVSFYLSAAAALAKCFVGTDFSESVVGLLILVYPRFFIWAIAIIVELMNPFVNMTGSGNVLFDASYNLVVNYMGGVFPSAASCLYTFALGIVYLALALFAFQKRPSETAMYPATSERLQGVIRTLISMAVCFLPIGILLLEDGNYDADLTFMAFILYVVAVVLYFVYDVMAHKKVSSVKLAAKKLWWLAALNIATILFILGVSTMVRKDRPDAEDIDYVVLMKSNSFYGDNRRDIYAVVAGQKLSGDEFVKAIAEELRYATDQRGDYGHSIYHNYGKPGQMEIAADYYSSRQIKMKIHLKSGRVLTRRLYLDKELLGLAKLNEGLEKVLNDTEKLFRIYNNKSMIFRVEKLNTDFMGTELVRSGAINLRQFIANYWNRMTVEEKWKIMTQVNADISYLKEHPFYAVLRIEGYEDNISLVFTEADQLQLIEDLKKQESYYEDSYIIEDEMIFE